MHSNIAQQNGRQCSAGRHGMAGRHGRQAGMAGRQAGLIPSSCFPTCGPFEGIRMRFRIPSQAGTECGIAVGWTRLKNMYAQRIFPLPRVAQRAGRQMFIERAGLKHKIVLNAPHFDL